MFLIDKPECVLIPTINPADPLQDKMDRVNLAEMIMAGDDKDVWRIIFRGKTITFGPTGPISLIIHGLALFSDSACGRY